MTSLGIGLYVIIAVAFWFYPGMLDLDNQQVTLLIFLCCDVCAMDVQDQNSQVIYQDAPNSGHLHSFLHDIYNQFPIDLQHSFWTWTWTTLHPVYLSP
jgi:hypothetical protein